METLPFDCICCKFENTQMQFWMEIKGIFWETNNFQTILIWICFYKINAILIYMNINKYRVAHFFHIPFQNRLIIETYCYLSRCAVWNVKLNFCTSYCKIHVHCLYFHSNYFLVYQQYKWRALSPSYYLTSCEVSNV